MKTKPNEVLWTERYRPLTLKDCVLPSDMRETLESYVAAGSIPNLLLTGRPGIGKTTVAFALCNEIGADPLDINGSLERNIDTLRTTIAEYVRYKSFDMKRKYVIIDEADYLNAQSTQPAMRKFMEENSKSCGFILTCNNLNMINTAIQSRCATLNFNIQADDVGPLKKEILKRVRAILTAEGITYDLEVVARLIVRHFPDIRKILNSLQGYAHGRKTIDAGMLAGTQTTELSVLFAAIKAGNYDAIRKWCSEYADLLDSTIFRTIAEQAEGLVEKNSVADLIIILGEHQAGLADGIDPEIHFAKMFMLMMRDLKWL